MNIISAQYSNFEHSCVILQTGDFGAVFVDLRTNQDMSGGWLAIYAEWSKTNPTTPYDPDQVF